MYRRQAECLIACFHIMFSPKEMFYFGDVAAANHLGSVLVFIGFQHHW